MKKLLATAVASLSLLVAAPVASAAGPPSGSPIQLVPIACTFDNGSTHQSWNFMLPSRALPYFQQALAQIEQYYPGALNCIFV